MANEFVIKNGFHSKGSSQITGSLNIGGSLQFDGNSSINYTPKPNAGGTNFYLVQPLARSGSIFLQVPGYDDATGTNDYREKLMIQTRVNAPVGQVTFSGSQVVFQYPTVSFIGLPSGSGQYPHSTLNVAVYDSASGQLYFTGSSAITAGSTPTLQQVTTAGNTTSNPIIIGNGRISDSGTGRIIIDGDYDDETATGLAGVDLKAQGNTLISVFTTDGNSTPVQIKTNTAVTGSITGDTSLNITGTGGISSSAGLLLNDSANGNTARANSTNIIQAPNTSPSSGAPGAPVIIKGGNSDGSGAKGGDLYLEGGIPSAGIGGNIYIAGGNGSTSGSVYLDGNGIFANPSLNTNTLKNYAGTQVLVSQSAAGATTIHGNNSSGTQIFESGESLFQIYRAGSPYVATLSASNNQYESRVIATYGRFSEIEGGSPLVINTGTSTLKISASNFNVSTAGEMSSGTGDGISTTSITASSDISSSGTITGNSFVKSGGTSAQFLKADGSVDSNTYLTSAFPFTGDAQITGSLNISGSFNATTIGSSNTTIGSGSGEDLTTGVQNILVGALAGKDNTIGDGNVFIGYEAGETNTLGDYNVAMGYQAGKNLGTGTANDNNVAIGYKAGMGSGYTDANYNVFIGHQAGIDVTSGDMNIGLGFNSLFELKGGSNNIALGYQTGVNISSGTKNVMIGYEAGFKVTTGANNIFIGEGSNGTKLGGETGTSNQLRIGIDDVVAISASLATGDVIFYNTASAPNFSGSFQGDGSNLTGTGTVVTGNGGGSGDTLSTISIGGTTFTVATGTGNGTVDTSGTPVANDYARFTDGNTIQGRSFAEVRTDLNIEDGADVTDATNVLAAGAVMTTGDQTIAGAKIFSSALSSSAFKLNDANALSFSGNILYVGNSNDWTTVELGRETTDEIHANGIFKAEQLLKAEQNAQVTGSLNITGSLEVVGSGSGLFSVEGSVGSLFTVNDGLDDVIFAANNISGTPVIEASADNTVKLGKLGGFGIVISGSTPAPNDSQAKIIITGSIHTSGSLGVGMAASSTIGRIDAKNDVVAFSTSDERLKDNITPIEDALNKVLQVQGIEFDWIEKEGVHGNEGHDVGVIAQEIEKVLPEVVATRDNGYKAVKYEKIIPLLVEAIKELQKEVQELKNSK
jgi:hypothetical protein